MTLRFIGKYWRMSFLGIKCHTQKVLLKVKIVVPCLHSEKIHSMSDFQVAVEARYCREIFINERLKSSFQLKNKIFFKLNLYNVHKSWVWHNFVIFIRVTKCIIITVWKFKDFSTTHFIMSLELITFYFSEGYFLFTVLHQVFLLLSWQKSKVYYEWLTWLLSYFWLLHTSKTSER